MNHKRLNIVLAVLLVVVIGTILALSSMPSDRSLNITSDLVKYMNELLYETGEINRHITYEIEIIVRKLAHFIEYLFLTTIIIVLLKRFVGRKWLPFFITLIVSIPLPFIDEFVIQTNAFGRTSVMLDVWIDLAGVLSAIFIGILYVLFMPTINKNQVINKAE